MSIDLLPQFIHSLAAMDLQAGEKILIAVSGGADSMALLHLFLRWDKQRIAVFHLNHRFRPEAEEEARFVEDYCLGFKIPVQISAYDVEKYLLASGQSKQQGARLIRYRLLEQYAREHGYQRIALGHHGDDQAETVLMRLLRGSGLQGLGGIPPRRGCFIRPLLSVFKSDILDYCRGFEIPYVEDPSNRQRIYFRNKIRHELLPRLEAEYNPELKKQLVQLADLAREDQQELQNQADEICAQNVSKKRGQLRFGRAAFAELSLAMQRRVLRTLLRAYKGNLRRIGFNHIETWRRQLAENTAFRLNLPGVWVSANADFIFVGEFKAEKWQPRILPVPGIVRAGGLVIRGELFAAGGLSERPKNCEDFDASQLKFPLLVRPRQGGDRLAPFRGKGSKKVKDLLIDARIPAPQRDDLPLICDREGILWIPGVRRSSSAPLSSETEQVVRLCFTAIDS